MLHCLLVLFLRCSDKDVVGNVHKFQEITEIGRYVVDKGLWIDAFISGRLFYFLLHRGESKENAKITRE